MSGKWTIFTTPSRRNTLHVAIASALWARVPEHEISVWYGKTHLDYQNLSEVIYHAIDDGFPEFRHIPIQSEIEDIVYIWNLCRYFRERSLCSEHANIFIQDNVYIKRNSRFGLRNWLILSHWTKTFFDVSRNYRQEEFTFALLSTQEIHSEGRDIQWLPNNHCFGPLPHLDFRLGIYTGQGCQILLDHLLSRIENCPLDTHLLDFVFSDLNWHPSGAFFSYYPLVETYRRQYD